MESLGHRTQDRYALVKHHDRLSLVDNTLPSASAITQTPDAVVLLSGNDLAALAADRDVLLADRGNPLTIGDDRLPPFALDQVRARDELRDPLSASGSKLSNLNKLIDLRVRRTLEEGADGIEALASIISVTTNHTMTREERLLLRSQMRDGAIDGPALATAIKTGSFAKVMGAIENNIDRQASMRSELADQQRDLVGRVNLAESFLPVRDQKILESALVDGRVNLRTMQMFLETGQDKRVTSTIIELDEEFENEIALGRDAGRELHA